MFVPVLTFPCLTGHHCKGLKKSGLWQCKQLQCKRPVDRSLMEPGIMVNRWCHLCPGGLAVWKRSVLVGVQSFCFTCSNSLFLDVFFFFGRFWPILVPCGFIFSSWEAAGETPLPSSQRNLRSLQFLGDQKRTKHRKLGSPPFKRLFQKTTSGVLVRVPFHEVPKWSWWSPKLGESLFGTGVGESKPNFNPLGWTKPQGNPPNKIELYNFFSGWWKIEKYHRDIGICELDFFS